MIASFALSREAQDDREKALDLERPHKQRTCAVGIPTEVHAALDRRHERRRVINGVEGHGQAVDRKGAYSSRRR